MFRRLLVFVGVRRASHGTGPSPSGNTQRRLPGCSARHSLWFLSSIIAGPGRHRRRPGDARPCRLRGGLDQGSTLTWPFTTVKKISVADHGLHDGGHVGRRRSWCGRRLGPGARRRWCSGTVDSTVLCPGGLRRRPPRYTSRWAPTT
ncbi:MAG: hypothetical protein R2695_19490 [Acidimicrobiales bacterium]